MGSRARTVRTLWQDGLATGSPQASGQQTPVTHPACPGKRSRHRWSAAQGRRSPTEAEGDGLGDDGGVAPSPPAVAVDGSGPGLLLVEDDTELAGMLCELFRD